MKSTLHDFAFYLSVRLNLGIIKVAMRFSGKYMQARKTAMRMDTKVRPTFANFNWFFNFSILMSESVVVSRYGNCSSGSGLSRNWHKGCQLSKARKTSNLSEGTELRTCCTCFSKMVIMWFWSLSFSKMSSSAKRLRYRHRIMEGRLRILVKNK